MVNAIVRRKGAPNARDDIPSFRPHEATAAHDNVLDDKSSSSLEGSFDLIGKVFKLQDMVQRGMTEYDVVQVRRQTHGIQVALFECNRKVFAARPFLAKLQEF